MKKIFVILSIFSICNNLFAIDNHLDQNIPIQNDTVYKIESIDVYPQNYARKMVMKAAKIFASKYSADFVSTFVMTNTIEANGEFRELFAIEALLGSFDFNQRIEKLNFLDKNRLDMIAILSLMRSNPYSSSGEFVLERSAIAANESTQKINLLIGYIDTPYSNSLTYKRALEIYSPLNAKMVNCYEFEIVESDTVTQTTVIHFKSIDKYFDKKNKISGEGYLYICNNHHFVKKIVMMNHIDKFSIFPRKKYITPTTPLATKHSVEINYRLDNNVIFPCDISTDIEWVDPKVDNDFYYLQANSRPRPIQSKLKESQRVKFYDFVEIDEKLKGKMRNQNLYFVNELITPCAPFIASRWNKNTISWLDWDKLERDLGNNGKMSLTEQAENNAFNLGYYQYDSSEVDIKKVINKSKHNTQNLYEFIYRKKYE